MASNQNKSDEAQKVAIVYLSLGSNSGNRENNLAAACTRLKSILKNFRSASIYETEPLYYQDQPFFLNTVIFGETVLSASELLTFTQDLESGLGRNRDNEMRMGPRPIDIDILLYDELIISSSKLTLPHPRMMERRFVLVPLLELNSGLLDPLSKTPYTEILKKLPVQGIYTYKMKGYT